MYFGSFALYFEDFCLKCSSRKLKHMDLNITSADPLSAISSYIVPVFIFLLGTGVIGTVIGIVVENRIKSTNSLEERLREDRSRTYFKLMIPFVKLFNKETNKEDAVAYLLSEEYRKTSFEAILIGSDDVVKAYGDLMQETFNPGRVQKIKDEKKKPTETIVLLGDLFLQLRKDLEHKDTKLTRKDMLRHMLTDIDEYDF